MWITFNVCLHFACNVVLVIRVFRCGTERVNSRRVGRFDCSLQRDPSWHSARRRIPRLSKTPCPKRWIDTLAFDDGDCVRLHVAQNDIDMKSNALDVDGEFNSLEHPRTSSCVLQSSECVRYCEMKTVAVS